MSQSANQPSLFISHTTRDERDRHLAHRLAAGLKEHGANVWMAPESIPAGDEWELHIVQGVMDACTHFLVILSEASVGSEWVLREIELAQSRRERDKEFKILPLFVGDVPDFNGRDWLAKIQQVPYQAEFSVQLHEVLRAAGVGPAVPAKYRGWIDKKTEDFVGRDYVFTAIEQFVDNNPSGYVTVAGDPGQGKSAILAEYAKRTGCVVHFNIPTRGEDTARHFLNNVCSQLINRFGVDCSLTPEATEDGVFLGELLDEISERLDEYAKLVIAVDALDEVDLSAQNPGANVLYLPAELPDKVFFFMTRRRTLTRNLPWRIDAREKVLDLQDYAEETAIDIRHYIGRMTEKRPRLRDWMDHQGMAPEEFVRTLAEKSKNNFMYLHHVLPAIEQEDGVYHDLTLDRIPRGLENYYEDHWKRMGMTNHPLPKVKINIVYILCQAGEPISCELAADFADQPVSEIRRVIDEWFEFLHEEMIGGEKHYSIYHSSFSEFLRRQDVLKDSGVDLADIARQLADNMWEDIAGNQ